MTATVVAWLAAALWWCMLLLPWRPWSTCERLPIEPCDLGCDEAALGDVTVLIPARDEAALLPGTLRALAGQAPGLRIIVIDDQSADATAALAAAGGAEVVPGSPLPAGWTGKLWALEQGRRRVHSRWILLLDADIELQPGTLAALRRLALERRRQLVSVMALLRTQGLWERALMPAFVFFFKLLYPFSLSNSSWRGVAAAAGGCMLVEARALHDAGGFAAIGDVVIDDCALARLLKSNGQRTWIGLSHAVRSQRACDSFGEVAHMVARTAYSQLRYSPLLLLACTLALALAFWVPVAALIEPRTRLPALLAWLAMVACYLPTLRFYRRSPLWCLALPLVGTAYLGMTWQSAWRCWRGVRSRWKGRDYGRQRG
ncbi:MAG TPA: glycosyltransferase [Rhodanobacteraceae bacterium]|nr:glycosyltransferase [Rhodanobacteraceae bacterium]